MLEIPLDGELLKVLASDTRRDILLRLAQRRMTLSELSQVLTLGKATVSEHLQRLVGAGLVDRHEDPERIWVYHSLSARGRSLMQPERVRLTFVWSLSLLGLVVGLLVAAALGVFLADGPGDADAAGGPQAAGAGGSAGGAGVLPDRAPSGLADAGVRADGKGDGADPGSGRYFGTVVPEGVYHVRSDAAGRLLLTDAGGTTAFRIAGGNGTAVVLSISGLTAGDTGAAAPQATPSPTPTTPSAPTTSPASPGASGGVAGGAPFSSPAPSPMDGDGTPPSAPAPSAAPTRPALPSASLTPSTAATPSASSTPSPTAQWAYGFTGRSVDAFDAGPPGDGAAPPAGAPTAQTGAQAGPWPLLLAVAAAVAMALAPRRR